MGVAKVTRNFQVTIPKDIRRVHDIKIGDEVIFAIEGDRIDFFKMERKDMLKEMAGSWKMKETGTEYTKKLRASWKKREDRI